MFQLARRGVIIGIHNNSVVVLLIPRELRGRIHQPIADEYHHSVRDVDGRSYLTCLVDECPPSTLLGKVGEQLNICFNATNGKFPAPRIEEVVTHYVDG